MEYRLLGKLEVRRDGEELDLGAFRQRALLALLLSEPNTIFSTDRIIDALWDGDGPGNRQNSLWVYVSGLRKILEPNREKRGEATVLVTRTPGYLLAAEPDEIDSVRFEKMVREGQALAPTDAAAASMVLGEALALWRGRAFEEFSYESFIQTEIRRLETLRESAVEARIDADLERGMARELLSELETLIRQHPLREEIAGQYMVALTRSGRQADALRAFQSLRTRLGDELGLEPSRSICALEEQIVTGTLPEPMGQQIETTRDISGLGVRGYELRDELGASDLGTVFRAYQPALGREVAIKVIGKELANDPNFIRHFEAEAQLAASVEDDSTRLYDYWREPDAAYLVMQLTESSTPGEVRGELDSSTAQIVERVTAFDPSFPADGQGRPGSIQTDIENAAIENPYMGLRSFDASHSHAFFGRERLIERLLSRMSGGGSKSRFVAIVGPSGCGKSSTAKAGLLPALRQDALVDSSGWFTVSMTPGTHPFEELESALRSVASGPHKALLEDLLADNGLHRAVEKTLPDDGSQFLLVIDQFEELFTLADDETAQRFLDVLAAAVHSAHSRVRVVVTLRADFYDRPLRHLQIGEMLREGTEIVTPMTPDELERAITGPAEPLGIRFEGGLVAEMVRDVADRSGALPLLQYLLTELFDARAGSMITHDAYRELGGVSGALAERAEGLYAQLGEHAHDIVREVFLRLVTFGDGVEDTRRRVLRSELEGLAVDRKVLDGVLDTFGRHRLLSFDRDPVTRGPTVEISHEALLREWLRFRNWIDSARQDVRSQRRLAEAMREWAGAARNVSFLLRGGRLDELEGWASRTAVPLSIPEQEFLSLSIGERDRLEKVEVERETRATEAERVAKQRLELLSGAALVGVLVTALAVFGVAQWRSASAARDDVAAERDQVAVERDRANEARDEATRARNDRDSLVTAAEYVTAAEEFLVDDPELSLLYGVEAIRSTADLGFATEEAVDSVHWALQQLGVHFDLGPDPATTTRSGPYGLTGVFLMPPADVIDVAEESTQRRLIDEECAAITGNSCGERRNVPDDLPFRFGEENYRHSLPTILPGTYDGPLAGTSVSIAISSVYGGIEGLEEELQRFTEVTGIDVSIVPDTGTSVTVAIGTGDVLSPPDVSVSYLPHVPDWASERAVDLSQFIDADQVRSDFGDSLTELLMVDTNEGPELQMVPVNVGPGGLIFYAKPAFDAAGYEIPETFDELIELSEQMVVDGQTPWCFFWESGWGTGWPGTDLLEGLVIRSQGLDAYDQWVAGDLDFASAQILDAAEKVERLLLSPGFADDSRSATSQSWNLPFIELLDVHPITGAPGPDCMFVHQHHAAAAFLGPNTDYRSPGVLGRDYGVFLLPPADSSDPISVTGAGSIAFAQSDRPEVRQLMKYIASPTWGEIWARTAADTNEPFISSNRRFDTAAYRQNQGFSELGATRVAIHEMNQAAIANGSWRWNASDLMPRGFGTWVGETPRPGPFYQGMSDWINEVRPIEEILASLDDERSTYE